MTADGRGGRGKEGMRCEGTAEYVATGDLMVAVNAAIRLERLAFLARRRGG